MEYGVDDYDDWEVEDLLHCKDRYWEYSGNTYYAPMKRKGRWNNSGDGGITILTGYYRTEDNDMSVFPDNRIYP